jgi:hypothetical protein
MIFLSLENCCISIHIVNRQIANWKQLNHPCKKPKIAVPSPIEALILDYNSFGFKIQSTSCQTARFFLIVLD